MHKRRNFAVGVDEDENQIINDGLACKICDRKFFMKDSYGKFREANEEQDAVLRDQ